LIAEELISSGTATHPYLGISAKRAAAVLATVVRVTPADQTGLKDGDAVAVVDAQPRRRVPVAGRQDT
jgi:S1-C subfamily serine protease